jgi:hypothetical protein
MVLSFSRACRERLNLIERRSKVDKLPSPPAPLFDLPDQDGQRSTAYTEYRSGATLTETVDALCKYLGLRAQVWREINHECSISGGA